MNAIVTGGAGRIGRRLTAELLDRGHDVWVLDDFSNADRDALPDGSELIAVDVRNTLKWMRGDRKGVNTDVIYHLAARVDVQKSMERPVDTHDVNVTGTLRVLEAARRTGASVVFASSAAVYGPPDYLPVDESHDRRPTSPYGLSKAAAENYVRYYTDYHGVDGVIMRYFNVYGPGQTGVVDTFVERARAGHPLEVHGDGEQTRDFVHVDDVVRATKVAAERGRPGVAYNVGTGRETSVLDLARLVSDEVATAPITHVERPPGDLERSEADVSRARQDLGYEPTVELDEYLTHGG